MKNANKTKKAKISPIVKSCVMKKEGGVSWSKIWAWITGTLATIVLLNAQLVSAGIPIPPEALPIFKFAAVASALITAIRMRNAASPTPPAEGK